MSGAGLSLIPALECPVCLYRRQHVSHMLYVQVEIDTRSLCGATHQDALTHVLAKHKLGGVVSTVGRVVCAGEEWHHQCGMRCTRGTCSTGEPHTKACLPPSQHTSTQAGFSAQIMGLGRKPLWSWWYGKTPPAQHSALTWN